MEFDIKRNPMINRDKYSKDEFDISYEFAKRAKEEFNELIKAIILFGSTAKKRNDPKSDIDILIIIDDLEIDLTQELVESYRILTEKIIAEVSPRLHITSLKFTTFWDYTRNGDPVGINMLREGFAILDMGFFAPLQILLKEGKIKPSAESIWTYFSRAPTTLQNSKWHVLQGSLDLYWAIIDASHAILMQHGEIPPAPENVADVIENKLVPKGILNERDVESVRFFYKLSRMITHNEIKEVSGEYFEKYYKRAKEYIDRIQEILYKKKPKSTD